MSTVVCHNVALCGLRHRVLGQRTRQEWQVRFRFQSRFQSLALSVLGQNIGLTAVVANIVARLNEF